MAPPVEAIRAGVYFHTTVAISLVAVRAAARDRGVLLGALGHLRTASVVLFAEIHSCKK